MKYVVFFTLILFCLAYAYHVETLQEQDEQWQSRLDIEVAQARQEGMSIGEISCLQNCQAQKVAEYNRGYQVGKAEKNMDYEAQLADWQQRFSEQQNLHRQELSRLKARHEVMITDTVTVLTQKLRLFNKVCQAS